jgi:hypothetical protein
MSKDFILNYAKGISNAPAYLVVYSTRDGAIVIHSCTILSGQRESVLIRKEYDNTECIVSDKYASIRAYLYYYIHLSVNNTHAYTHKINFR